MGNIIDNYQVYPEQRFILQRLLGVVSMENLLKVKLEQDQDPSFDPDFSLLTDVREADVQFTPAEIQAYIQYLQAEFKGSKGRKIALVTSSPMAVAVGTLVQSNTGDLSDELQLFSTIPAALSWLGVDLPKAEVSDFFEGNLY